MINDHDPFFSNWVVESSVSEQIPPTGSLVLQKSFIDNDNGVAGSFGSFTVRPLPPAGIYFIFLDLL